jgi:hypothetical protein
MNFRFSICNTTYMCIHWKVSWSHFMGKQLYVKVNCCYWCGFLLFLSFLTMVLIMVSYLWVWVLQMGFRSYIYSRIFGLHYHPIIIYAYGLIVFSFKGILFGFWYSPLFLLIVFLLWDKTWLIILGAWKMNWAYFYWWQIIERLHFVSLWSLTPKTFCNIEHLGYVSELREDD